jgi:hypothetical protein
VLWNVNQYLTIQPINQLTSAVHYSTWCTMSWLCRITLKTNIFHRSQFIHLYVTKYLPSSGMLRSVHFYIVKDVSGKHIGHIIEGQAAQEWRDRSYCISLKAVRSILVSSLCDASHLNSVWDIRLCRWNSCNMLREENINIALPQFMKFYFTNHYKWKLVTVCKSMWFTSFAPAVILGEK